MSLDARVRPTPSVVVAGGGPVGLTAACLLSAYGVPVTVLERNPTTSNDPKAISLDDESLRTFALAGIGDALEPIVLPGIGTRYFGADGQPLFLATSPEPYRVGHPFKNPFAQPVLERVLAAELARQPGVQLRFDTELRALTQRSDCVEVTVGNRGQATEETLIADFLVGCDGGRSTVRELLGIGMAGRSHDDAWLVADVLGDPHRERYGLHLGLPQRPTVIIPGEGGRCRYEFRLHRGEGRPGHPPGFELVQRLLAPYRRLAPEEIERAVIYTFHAVVADRWRDGRVLLAGDAAHMMPPFAGQGLNSGLRDVANLAFKIAAVIDGTLQPSVLDTYELERRPHAEATVRISERLGRIVFTTDPRRARIRDRLVRTALRTRRGRGYLTQMRYRPAARLDAGLVLPGGTMSGVPIPQPRVFDLRAHRARLLDEVLGRGFSLIGVDVDPSDWELAADLAWLVDVQVDAALDGRLPDVHTGRAAVCDLDGRLQSALSPARGQFVLVRPDRVVAGHTPPAQLVTLSSVVARWRNAPTTATRFDPERTP